MTAPVLPTLARLDVLPMQEVRLTLDDGRAVVIDLDASPRALLCPAPSGLLLLEDWRNAQAATYYVPAELAPALRAAFHLRRVGA